MQRALIQYRNPELYDLVLEALRRAGRMDLVGYGPKCLIRPKRSHENHAAVPYRANKRGTVKNRISRKPAVEKPLPQEEKNDTQYPQKEMRRSI